jgi:hypothetical protein
MSLREKEKKKKKKSPSMLPITKLASVSTV